MDEVVKVEFNELNKDRGPAKKAIEYQLAKR
jgi:hypothetical protein